MYLVVVLLGLICSTAATADQGGYQVVLVIPLVTISLGFLGFVV